MDPGSASPPQEDAEADRGREHRALVECCATWELAVKVQLGKLRLPMPPDEFLAQVRREEDLTPVPILDVHALAAAALPVIHRDPFDRMLVAQARVEQVPLLTAGRQMAAYGIECIEA
ncbi:MAG: type II toxin-antitoxin system VapC family toxin [Planctomycetota bacterium]